jgi:hypothetical protein
MQVNMYGDWIIMVEKINIRRADWVIVTEILAYAIV